MKRIGSICLAAMLAASFPGGLFADTFDPLDNFKENIADSLVKPFAADLGGLIGGADFSSGRTIGFPGFDIGAVGMTQTRPGRDNVLLRTGKVKAFGLGMLQGSVALPFLDTDVVLRGVSYSNFSVIGGGLRRSIFRSGTLTKFIPDVSVSAFFDAVNFKYFTGRHLSADLAASFDLPFIKPFVGMGYDRTRVEIKGVSAALDGMDAITSRPRYTAGARIVPFPFLYVFGAYTVLHERHGFNFGAGARF
jgi:hypothetical protein